MAQLIPFIPLFALLLEIAGFVIVGQWLGLLATLALVVLGTMAGLAILRLQGVFMLRRMQASLAAGEQPVAEAFDAACLALAGILLIVPGFFSDLLALLLLLPPLRHWAFRWIARRVERDGGVTFGTRGGKQRTTIIEGEFIEIDGEDGIDREGRAEDRDRRHRDPKDRLPPS